VTVPPVKRMALVVATSISPALEKLGDVPLCVTVRSPPVTVIVPLLVC
jgi:hypothetical protein